MASQSYDEFGGGLKAVAAFLVASMAEPHVSLDVLKNADGRDHRAKIASRDDRARACDGLPNPGFIVAGESDYLNFTTSKQVQNACSIGKKFGF